MKCGNYVFKTTLYPFDELSILIDMYCQLGATCKDLKVKRFCVLMLWVHCCDQLQNSVAAIVHLTEPASPPP